MSYAEDLAFFACTSELDDLADSSVSSLKRSILDALGCGIAAIDEQPVRAVRRTVDGLGGVPASTLIGGGKTAPDRAALYNGTAIRYLDFNDTYLGALEGGHPSDNLAPVMAAAEQAGRSGPDLLIALAVAYQVQCRLIEAAPVRARGFDHTTLAPYAVASGVSRVLELDESRTAHAIRIAGTALNALRVTRTGRISHWKGLAYPSAAGNATEATYLAMNGVTGPELVFEGAKGFMETIAGPFEIAWRDETFNLIEMVIFKRYNAEGHSQTALEALEHLRHEHGFSPDDIEKVEISVFSACYNIIGGGDEGDKHVVHTKEEADHSLPFMAAAYLLDGELTPKQYKLERIDSKDVQDLLGRITVIEEKAFNDRFPSEMPSRVVVSLKDGTELIREQADYSGYRTRPMTWDEVVTKFLALCAPFTSESLASEIVSIVENLESLDEVTELTGLLGAVPLRQ